MLVIGEAIIKFPLSILYSDNVTVGGRSSLGPRPNDNSYIATVIKLDN